MTVDEIVQQILNHREKLEAHPRSLEKLQEALTKAFQAANREAQWQRKQQREHPVTLGFRHDPD